MIQRLISILLCVALTLFTFSWGHKLGVQYMTPGISYKTGHPDRTLSIYCYKGVPKDIFKAWQTVHVSITLQPEQYALFHGTSPEVVYQMYEDRKSSWAGRLFTWRSKTISLDPFSQSCVGIETSEPYSIGIRVKHTDWWKFILLLSGICLFLAAPRLSSNPLFYYICGVTLGISASILIAFYFISKLIPRKPAVYGFLAGGWMISFYVLQLLWDNVKLIALNFQREVIGYIFITGVISFIVCYRFGPVTDPRSKNLIKWALQCLSLAAMYYSSAYQEMSIACILLLLLYYNFPASWTAAFKTFWRRRFPPKRRLLTEDEYHRQGVRETTKALEELRKYCSSPECKQWRTVLSLREPVRFAQFVEGKPHVAEAEVMKHESEVFSPDLYTEDHDDYDPEMFDNWDDDDDDEGDFGEEVF